MPNSTILINLQNIYDLVAINLLNIIYPNKDFNKNVEVVKEYLNDINFSYSVYFQRFINDLVAVVLLPIIINNQIINQSDNNAIFKYEEARKNINLFYQYVFINNDIPLKLEDLHLLSNHLEIIAIRIITGQFKFLDSFQWTLIDFKFHNYDLYLFGSFNGN